MFLNLMTFKFLCFRQLLVDFDLQFLRAPSKMYKPKDIKMDSSALYNTKFLGAKAPLGLANVRG